MSQLYFSNSKRSAVLEIGYGKKDKTGNQHMHSRDWLFLLYTIKSSTFAYSWLSYNFMFINPCKEKTDNSFSIN